MRPFASLVVLVLGVLLLAPLAGRADDAGAGTVDPGGAEAEPGGAQAAETSPEAPAEEPVPSAGIGEKVFDVLILRPFGTAATIGGFAFYLISVPLVAPAKNLPVTWDIFVLGPYDYTFERPLGEF